MLFTADAVERINTALDEKKRENPMSHTQVGIGINAGERVVYQNSWQVCTYEELSRMIEELTMLRDAVEETVGVII